MPWSLLNMRAYESAPIFVPDIFSQIEDRQKACFRQLPDGVGLPVYDFFASLKVPGRNETVVIQATDVGVLKLCVFSRKEQHPSSALISPSPLSQSGNMAPA